MSLSKMLQIQPFIPSMEIIPSDTVYINYPNTGGTYSQLYDMKPPSPRSLLDSEVWMQHTLRITDNTAGDTLNNIFAPNDNINAQDSVIAFRQGFVTHSQIQCISLYINNTTINENPINWTDHVMRYYITQKENDSVVTMSGGKIDTKINMWYPNSQVAIGTLPANGVQTFVGFGPFNPDVDPSIRTQYSVSPEYYNSGFDWRFTELFKHAREQRQNAEGQGGAEVRQSIIADPNTWEAPFEVIVFERIPVSPFHLWDKKDKRNMIPHIREMQLRIEYKNDSIGMMGGLNQGVTLIEDELSVRFKEGASKILCRWITPPVNMSIPKSVIIPITQFRTFFKKATDPGLKPAGDWRSETATTTFNDLRLEQMPSKFYLYVCGDKANKQFQDPSEFCSQIVSVTVKIAGNAGKMIRIESRQLYAMYSENMSSDIHLDWRSWRRYFCTVVLRPEDIGLQSAMGSGSGVPLVISVTVEHRMWYTQPAIRPNLLVREQVRDFNSFPNARDQTFYIIAQYNKARLHMHENSKSTWDLFSKQKNKK